MSEVDLNRMLFLFWSLMGYSTIHFHGSALNIKKFVKIIKATIAKRKSLREREGKPVARLELKQQNTLSIVLKVKIVILSMEALFGEIPRKVGPKVKSLGETLNQWVLILVSCWSHLHIKTKTKRKDTRVLLQRF